MPVSRCFAATGALCRPSRKAARYDRLRIFLAAVTGIGGGTFRDIVLGATPVFWVERNTRSCWVCVGVAVIVYFTAHVWLNRATGCCSGSMRSACRPIR